ncbi:Uncharacterized protein FWK35_00029684 [Aphis craccivora]|uniref:Uncharacterized protein n=1 Tax=Aphis craccivora TaxID=307492 RepID=A0A6G0VQA4_APHCR|nr:Uncharacterized protein FWK35_00029684 [Aphis craccivora]
MYSIRVCYTLINDHINPSNYQKMNDKMAIQFFGHAVAAAMEHYKEKGIGSLKLVNQQLYAMNS